MSTTDLSTRHDVIRVTVPLPADISFRDYQSLLSGVVQLIYISAQVASAPEHSELSAGEADTNPPLLVSPDRLRARIRVRFAHYGSDAEFVISIIEASEDFIAAISALAAAIISAVALKDQSRSRNERRGTPVNHWESLPDSPEERVRKLRELEGELPRPTRLSSAESVSYVANIAADLEPGTVEPTRRQWVFFEIAHKVSIENIRLLASLKVTIKIERGR